MQHPGLAITWGGPDADRRIVWAEPPPELFQFSSERNVIHVVLDEFQTDVFVAMLEEDGGSLGRTFTGFTFFADHLGAFPSTSLSVPAMLTGKEFRNEQPVPEFVRQAFSETARDRTITWVKTLGRRQWKQASGYHRQGRVENTFFRDTSIIGDGLRARKVRLIGRPLMRPLDCRN